MKIGIIMGSDSDLEVMSQAAKVLDEFGISYEITIVSAHRTPERMYRYAKTAEKRNIEIIIAGAGGSAHLPGMIASLTTIPVIGVPIQSRSLNGLDSLFSIVQMPPSIPVATVAINGAKNAALIAISILSLKYSQLKEKLKLYRKKIKKEVLNKASKLEEMGYIKYLKELDK